MRRSTPAFRSPLALPVLALLAACGGGPPPAPPPLPTVELPRGSPEAPVLTPEQALESFRLPPGYRVEIVAAEPLVQDPVQVAFDADGRMYVVEMRGYMPNRLGEGELEPVGRIVVLEDVDDDGRMDTHTIFMDSLVLPRSVAVLDHGVLIAEPPNLWLARDLDGDLRADTREAVRQDYGTLTANPEHNANGLLWGLDNRIHNSAYAGQFRLRDGRIDFVAAPSEGQWGLSMDDYGRLFRNSNEDPLRGDFVPSRYATRNPNLPTMRGVYERLTANVPVWPIRNTAGVNRGYRPQTVRPDGTLAHYTAAGWPTAYVGDRLPAELRGSVFIAEPAGNLVGRFVVEESETGSLTARRAEERTDFMASTDERFRPVSLASAPDGTLYVVDMYRGIIQHRMFITGYLEQHIMERGLGQPIGLGRIYRIVHESTERGRKPDLSDESPARLVRHLSHPNGWWRMTAQRLLVERGDASVAPSLRRLARGAEDDRTRLHALWTLDGLAQIDAGTLEGALEDPSPHVRIAALQIAEAWLPEPGHRFAAAVLRRMDDPSPAVRRQLAGTVGALPPTVRATHLAALAARDGADPVVADLVVSALPGRELAFLERLLGESGASGGPAATVRSLVSAIARGRDPGPVLRVAELAGEEGRARWQREALLAGLPTGQPGGGGPVIELAAVPRGLLATAESSDTALANRARAVSAALGWPGKPQPVREVRPLTPEEQQRFAAGREPYTAICAACHQADGTGIAGLGRSLVGSPWVTGNATHLIRIVLHGKEGEMLMPPAGGTLNDEEVAAVLTYVRRSWGNEADPVTPAAVHEVRGATLGRTRPWTEAELQ